MPNFIRISLQSKTLPPPYPFSFTTNKAKSHSLTLPTSSGSFPISPHSYFLKDSLAFLVTSCILGNMSYEEYSFKILQQFADRGDQAIWNLRGMTDNEKTGRRKKKTQKGQVASIYLFLFLPLAPQPPPQTRVTFPVFMYDLSVHSFNPRNPVTASRPRKKHISEMNQNLFLKFPC